MWKWWHGNAHHQNPADVLSFTGHTLGFRSQESLVRITLDTNHIGVTSAWISPKHDGDERAYPRTVAGYLANDTNATSALFAAPVHDRGQG
jgi:hypothetical protein